MAKLKNVIKQLSTRDYNAIYKSLIESSAEKSAYLLRSIRERQLTDSRVMDELEVNVNAYYTLRSRLNQKIEEHLLQQLESPRTDLLKKVANLNEVLFTKKKTIAITTLKKLERELLDYDLSNELTVIYKALKKLHLNTPDYFTYSQLYNRHVAYMLSVDKAESLLAEYFKKYSEYLLTNAEADRMGLQLFLKEINNVAAMYESHRLYVYQSCMIIFHRLFVNEDETMNKNEEAIEDILNNVEKIFSQYRLDSIYYHLNLLFEFLKMEYYNHYGVYRKVEHYYEEVNDAIDNLLTNYSLYTFPARFLITKIKRHARMGTGHKMQAEIQVQFHDFDVDKLNTANYVVYSLFRAISSYHVDDYEDAIKWLYELLTESNLKQYPAIFVEVKLVLAIQYCLQKDFDLFNQQIGSIQRHIRVVGKENFSHVINVIKLLKVAMSEVRTDKRKRLRAAAAKIGVIDTPFFSPVSLIQYDDSFIKKVVTKFDL